MTIRGSSGSGFPVRESRDRKSAGHLRLVGDEEAASAREGVEATSCGMTLSDEFGQLLQRPDLRVPVLAIETSQGVDPKASFFGQAAGAPPPFGGERPDLIDNDLRVWFHPPENVTCKCDFQEEHHIVMFYESHQDRLEHQEMRFSKGNNDQAFDRRDSLKRFMALNGLNAKKWAEEAGISPNTLYNFFAHRSQKLEPETYQKLADAAGVDIDVLLGENKAARIPGVTRVVGQVQAGAWRPAVRWADDEQYLVAAPVPQHLLRYTEGYLVIGPSMNRVYADGSIVFAVSPYRLNRPVRNGDRVVVQRTRSNGDLEVSIKELKIDEQGRPWLWPQSHDPEHQTPLRYEDSPGETDLVEIIGIIVGSFQPEPGFQ